MTDTQQQSNSSVATDLQLLYSTSVTEDQIDQLGHMNVRFYGVHALAGARQLVKQIGLPDTTESNGDSFSAFTDLYTRHHLEQLEGAPLEVWGGVLAVHEIDIRMYFELRNPVRDELGAAFVFTVQHQDSKSRTAIPLTDSISDAAKGALIQWPEHGQPRSIDLDVAPRPMSLDKLQARNTPTRVARTINEEDCDENGLYRIDRFQDLVWGSEGISEGIGEDNDWLRTLENGDKMGWATMESRCSLLELPRIGTRVQSFYTTVGVNRKAQHERFWVFDIDRNVLLCTAAFVDVAFNINTRRAIEIPEFERARIDEHFHPDLA